MMRSNAVSLSNETITFSLLLDGLSGTQDLLSSDHLQRIYSYEMSLVGPKQLRLRRFTIAVLVISPFI